MQKNYFFAKFFSYSSNCNFFNYFQQTSLTLFSKYTIQYTISKNNTFLSFIFQRVTKNMQHYVHYFFAIVLHCNALKIKTKMAKCNTICSKKNNKNFSRDSVVFGNSFNIINTLSSTLSKKNSVHSVAWSL